jgi:hypothetical protein
MFRQYLQVDWIFTESFQTLLLNSIFGNNVFIYFFN